MNDSLIDGSLMSDSLELNGNFVVQLLHLNQGTIADRNVELH